MNFYKCYIESKKYPISHVHYIWADSDMEAVAAYRKQYPELKRKKNLTVQAIEYRTAKKLLKVIEETVVYKVGNDGTQFKRPIKVSRFVCSNCGHVIKNEPYCLNCDSEIIDNAVGR